MRSTSKYISTEYSNRFKRMVTVISAVFMMLVLMVTISFNAFVAEAKVKAITENDIKAGSAIVFSGSTSEVVYSLHDERKLPMGNLTKLMTAMVVIDNIHNQNEYANKVKISAKAAKLGKRYKKGQEVTVEQLLKDMLARNSDEAAWALAEYSATQVKIFVSEMNSKVMEFDLMNTQYVNPTGAYDINQYSTTHDSAVIAQYAFRYPFIREQLAMNSRVAQTGGFIGAITGTLSMPKSAAQTMVASERDGMQIIVILLEGDANRISKDVSKLTEYGYAKVSRHTIVKANKKVGTARVKHGASTRVTGYTKTKGYAYIPPEGTTDLVQTEVVMKDNLEAPIAKGAVIGEYRIYVADELKGTVDIVTDREIKTGWFPSYIYISNLAVIIIGTVLTLVIAFVLRVRYVKLKRRRIREAKRQAKIREMAMRQKALEEDRKRRNWTYK